MQKEKKIQQKNEKSLGNCSFFQFYPQVLQISAINLNCSIVYTRVIAGRSISKARKD